MVFSFIQTRALVRILRVPVLKKILVKRGRGSFLHTHFYCIFMQQFFPEYVDLSKSSGAIAPVTPVLTRALLNSIFVCKIALENKLRLSQNACSIFSNRLFSAQIKTIKQIAVSARIRSISLRF